MKNLFKRITKYLVFVLAIVLIPQALNIQSELNMRVVVSAMAVDYENNEYEVTAQIIKPSSSTEGGSAEMDFVSAKNKDIARAIEQVSFLLGRTTGYSHLTAIILGKSVLDEDKTMESLDYFMRERSIPKSALLLVSEEKAKDELEKTKKLQLASAVGIQKIFLYKQLNSNAVMMQLQTFFNDYFSTAGCSVISGFKIESKSDEQQKNSGGESGSSGNSGGGESSGEGEKSSSSDDSKEKDGRVKFDNNIYVFKDGDLKIELKNEESISGINYINVNSKEGLVSVDNVNNNYIKDAKVSMYFRDKKVKMRVDFNNGKPICKIFISTNRNEIYSIESKDVSTELYQTEKSYLTDDVIEAVKTKISDCIQSAFKDCQDAGADILQIGNRLYRNNPQKWREFINKHGEDYIKEITLEVYVKVKKQI